MMSGRQSDIQGKKFGKLTVISLSGNIKFGKPSWDCLCDCGNSVETISAFLKNGNKYSCGCSRRNKHGESYNRIHRIWDTMIGRCYRPGNTSYNRYGAVGVKVCSEWMDYSVFKKWAVENGYNDDLSIDRINNYGNYEPSNCRWATVIEQSRNKKNNRIILYKGESLCLSEWAERLGMNQSSLSGRLQRGWSIEDTVTKPPIKTGRWG